MGNNIGNSRLQALRLILLVMTCISIVHSEDNKIEYLIPDFPDTLKSNYDSTIAVKIRNISGAAINLLRLANSIEVDFSDKSGKKMISYVSHDDFQTIGLEPKEEYAQEFTLSTLTYADTFITCPHVDYRSCKNAKDSLLASIVGLCGTIGQQKPIPKGIYSVTIYCSIFEQGNMKQYYRFQKKLVVK